MKLLMLSSGDRVPSSRFRMHPYVPHFRTRGHRCVVAASVPQKYDWFPALGFRLSQRLKRAVRWWHWRRSGFRGDDVVIIDREIFDAPDFSLELRFRESTPRLVLDLDDAVFFRYPEKFEALTKIVDLVLCGNRWIEEWVQSRNPRTLILPTCVEMAQYPARPAPSRGAGPVRIGWIGTTGNLRYLQAAAAGLRALARQIRFELHLIVPEIAPLREVDLSGVTVVHRPWDKSREVEQLHEIDIGLMPLFADEAWDRYKCGLKLIQYMAVGLPAVASPVGVNAEIVVPGENGYLAASDADWTETLGRLAESSGLRRELGARARQTVAAEYSIEANFPRYEAALLKLCGSA